MTYRAGKSSRAFTLIELLVVISIVALLSSIVLASLNAARENGRLASLKQFSSSLYHAAADQAIGIWDFDECSGTIAQDRSGYGNNGTLNNSPTWSTDTPSGTGCSILLNGTNQWVTMGNPAILNVGTGDLTLSVWIKTTAGSGRSIIDKKSAGSNAAGFDLSTNATPLLWRIANGTAQTGITATGNTVINDGKWHNLVGVVSRADSLLYLYVDGKLNKTGGFTSSWDLSGGNSFNVGTYGGGGYFPGNVDNVQVFNKTLTAQEVRDRYFAELDRSLVRR